MGNLPEIKSILSYLILNSQLKANFHQEFELFQKTKFMLTMVDTLILSAQ